MLRELRRSLVVQARRSGMLDAVANSRWRRSRLLILCYHGISREDEHLWDPELFISSQVFQRRMEILQRGKYSVLSLAEALKRLAGGELPPRAVAITFDDGFEDFASVAYPILKRLGFPATVYLRTDHVENRLPIFPLACRYMIWKSRRPGFPGRLVDEERDYPIATADQRREAVLRLMSFVRQQGLTPGEKDALARRLAADLDFDYGDLSRRRILNLMTPEEARGFSRDLVDVQLHTHRHVTPRERAAFTAEIADNRSALQRILGSDREFVHFCYPSGDYDLRFLPWLREAGVRSATTGVRGFANATAEPLLLPRFVDTSPLPEPEFEGWIAGLSAWLPRRGTRPLTKPQRLP